MGNIIGPNPFPAEWRAQPKIANALPTMLRADESQITEDNASAHEFIANMLTNSATPLTVLMTGPASNLAEAINIAPNIQANIEQVIWMGGAIDVKGNVAMHDHNGSAEWNAYWDPQATHDLIFSDLNLSLVPLDATNDLPVNMAFLNELAAAKTPVSDLAGQLWAATVTAIPAYEFTYFLWDILSTSLLGLTPSMTKFEKAKLNVEVNPPSAGRIYHDNQNGHMTQWLKSINANYVKRFVIHYLSGDFATVPDEFNHTL